VAAPVDLVEVGDVPAARGVWSNSPSTNSCFDLEAYPYEERRHGVEVRDGDADVIEASCRVTWGSILRLS
jgi:hypothetical protein